MQHSESLMHGEYEYVVHFTHPKGLPVKCNHDLFNEQFMHYTNRFFFLESIFFIHTALPSYVISRYGIRHGT